MSKEFAVIKTGGKQYRVSKGDKLKVEKLPKEEGKDVVFDQVLLFANGKDVEVGTPTVKGVKVSGKVLEQGKNKKVIVFKFKKRKRYRKQKGHRQPYTEVEITDISKGGAPKSKTSEQAVKKPAAKKTAEKKPTTKK